MAEQSSAKKGVPSGAIHPVLVAVDFTADSKAALFWAADYAACVHAPLEVLHVVHDPGETPGAYRRTDQDLLRPMQDVATDLMAEFLAEAAKERPKSAAIANAKQILVTGVPATRVLEVAERHGARIIVVGSRGRTGLPHLLLGSKAERIAQLSPIPVTIIKAGPEDGTA